MSRRTRGRRRPTWRQPSPWRIATALGLASVLGWGVVSTSGAALLRSASPDAVLRVAPWDAYALARVADRRAGTTPTGNKAAFAAIGATAQRAIARDPTIASAWRTLGLARAVNGDERGAAALMASAERVSRRDLPTQLWLVEAAVNRNDIGGALTHYDVAMRIKPSSTGLLIPIMVGALDTSEVRPVVARLVAGNPPWAGDFFYVLGQKPPADGITARFFREVRAAGAVPTGPAVDSVIPNLIARNRFAEAAAVLAVVENHAITGVRDGAFDRPGSHPPLDWQFGEKDDLTGEVRDRPDQGGPALFAASGSAGAGVAAQQLLTLRPGRYRLFSRSGGTDRPAPEALEWRLTCAGPDTSIGVVPVSLRARGTGVGDFTVPAAACGGQWLSLYIRSGTDPQGSEAWVDDVRIAPAGRSLPETGSAAQP